MNKPEFDAWGSIDWLVTTIGLISGLVANSISILIAYATIALLIIFQIIRGVSYLRLKREYILQLEKNIDSQEKDILKLSHKHKHLLQLYDGKNRFIDALKNSISKHDSQILFLILEHKGVDLATEKDKVIENFNYARYLATIELNLLESKEEDYNK